MPQPAAIMQALGAQVGTGAFLGLSMGYFLKKMVKLTMLLVGMVMSIAAFVELKGWWSFDWQGIASFFGGAFSWVTGGIGGGSVMGFVTSLIHVVPLGGSFTAAAFLGFKYG